jgi:hypothetical protein
VFELLSWAVWLTRVSDQELLGQEGRGDGPLAKDALHQELLNDGEEQESDDGGDEGFEDEDDGGAAQETLGSPAKKEGNSRTPRRNGIEFLQVTCDKLVSLLF